MRLLVKVIPVFVVMAVATPSFAIETVVVTASRLYDDGRGKVGHVKWTGFSFPHGHEVSRAINRTERRTIAEALAAIMIVGIDISKGANANVLVNDAIDAIAEIYDDPRLTQAVRNALWEANEALLPYAETITKTPTVLNNIAVRLNQALNALQLAAYRGVVTYIGAGVRSFVGTSLIRYTAQTLIIGTNYGVAAWSAGYLVGTMIYNYVPLVQMGAIGSWEALDNIRRRIVAGGGGRRGGAHR